jgi:hypothetical protein
MIKLYGIWNIHGNKWVLTDAGNDFKSAYEIAAQAMENMVEYGAAREGMELREYIFEAIV